MKKRIFSILIAGFMLLGIAACGGDTPADGNPANTGGDTQKADGPGNDDTPQQPEISNDPITLKVMQWALDNQSTDFKNLWYYQQLEADTNVTVDWTVIKESDWNQTMNLTFASGELPDVIIRPNQNLNIEEYGVLTGMLLPLNDKLEANMPNYYSRLDDELVEMMTSSDGNMYYIGYLIAQNINHNAHFFMNQTWLGEVGMEVPTTIDELTAVLLAFRDQGVGADGSYGLSAGGGIEHQTQGIYTYFGMFGVPLQRWVYANIGDDDVIRFPGYADGFREACEWLAMCYAEGLLDPDALTQDENKWNAKINGNQIGFQTYLRLTNSAWTNPDTIQNWTSILPPTSSNGAMVPRELEVPEYGAVVTVTNKNVERTLRWLDAQFETERMLTAANGPTALDDKLIALFGEDGEDIDGDGNIDAPLMFENDMWKASYVPANNALYKLVPVTQGQFFAPGDYYFDIFELPVHRIERMENAVKYEAVSVVEKNSYQILTRLIKPEPDHASELQRLHADIETLTKQTIANFITSGVTDDGWNKFLSEADNVGVNRYLEIYQQYYDAYIAAVR